MSISIEELNRMNPDSYQIIDIRDEAEIGHGAIPGAVAVATEEIEGNEKIDFSKKLVICCSRGKYSVDVAEELSEKGIDAESLEGGYIAWLIDNMKQKEAAEKAWREEIESRLLRGAADKTAGGYVDQLSDKLYLPAGSET